MAPRPPFTPTTIRRSLALASLGLTLASAQGCRDLPDASSPAPADDLSRTGSPAGAAADIDFERVTDQAGVRFRHSDGGSGRKYFVEVMGPGCGMFDYDGDGWLDLYLVNGGILPGYKGPRPTNSLYRNRRDGTFEDVTANAKCAGTGYGIGCCAGDYDGDGDLDLYVTQFGTNVLYRNNGDGTFADVTGSAGVGKSGFSAGAAFGDYDGDGRLDLYVAGYVQYDPLKSPACTHQQGAKTERIYCLPTVYPGASGTLYHNEGGGRFRDVSRETGIAVPAGRSLGCLWVDYNNDHRLDLYVANDMAENFLFKNLGKGRFEEVAVSVGAGLNGSGKAQAGMGVASTDVDADGNTDLVVTNFTGEYAALYRNLGDVFSEVSAQGGLLEGTRAGTGFGVGFQDFDLDGRDDLFIANGHVTEDVERFYEGISLPQLNTLHRNLGDGKFEIVLDAGFSVSDKKVHRGAAFGDFDNDGRVDILVSNWRGSPDVLRNNSSPTGNSLRIRLTSASGLTDRIGAEVTVKIGGLSQKKCVQSGGSYCSQNDLRLTFGLASAEVADSVSIHWPSGKVETREQVAMGDWIVREGAFNKAQVRSWRKLAR